MEDNQQKLAADIFVHLLKSQPHNVDNEKSVTALAVKANELAATFIAATKSKPAKAAKA